MGLMANPYQEYKRQDVMMASPMELIVMLYSGCIKQLKLARLSLGSHEYGQANISLQKAQDIVVELMMSLDLQYEISKELMEIYEFLLAHIMRINANKTEEPIGPLIDILENLRSTWIQVHKQSKTKMLRDDDDG